MSSPHIRVASLNVAMLPIPTSIESPWRQRARVKLLHRTVCNLDIDVLCLQEAWRFGWHKNTFLFDMLRNIFPYVVWKGDDDGDDDNAGRRCCDVRANHGLAIASRFPLEDVRQKTFDASHAIDSLARKGVLWATVRLPRDRTFVVVTTHLQSAVPDQPWWMGRTPSRARVREAQHDQLQDVRHVLPQRAPYVLLGDFNIAYRSAGGGRARYEDMVASLGSESLVRDSRFPTYPCASSAAGDVLVPLRRMANPMIIDHAFARGIDVISAHVYKVVHGGLSVSDHAMVLVTIGAVHPLNET